MNDELRAAQMKQLAQRTNGAVVESPHDSLRPIALGKFLDLELPEPKPMLGPILQPGSLAMVHGPAGVGKTYLMLAMALALSQGVDLLGWPVPEPRAAIYVDGEMTAYELQKRLKALLEPIHRTIDHPWKTLWIVTPDLLPTGVPKIDSPQGQKMLLDLVDDCRLEGLGAVFLDNLSCLTAPEDDNAASSWSAVQELLLGVRRRSVAAMLGHHSGKGGQQRGTSRRADILDLILCLKAAPDPIADGRTRIIVEFEKARALSGQQRAPFQAVLEGHPTGGLMWTRSGDGIPKMERISQMLLDGMPAGEVARELEAAPSFVYRIRKQLLESGELAESNRRRGQKSGDSRSSPNVVPWPPLIGGRGQGDKRPRKPGDKSGEYRGNRGDKDDA